MQTQMFAHAVAQAHLKLVDGLQASSAQACAGYQVCLLHLELLCLFIPHVFGKVATVEKLSLTWMPVKHGS